MRLTERSQLFTATVLLAVMTLCPAAAARTPVLKMATTTSVDNSGFFDYTAPMFLQDTGIEIQWIPVEPDKALKYGRNGDVDVVMTHDPDAEEKFMAEGSGINRRTVMRNDFVLIGPRSDPAGVVGKPIIEAIKIIAAKKQIFIGCVDKSWTHAAELKLLAEAGVGDIDKSAWYIKTSQGIHRAIDIAAECGGYTLADRDAYD